MTAADANPVIDLRHGGAWHQQIGSEVGTVSLWVLAGKSVVASAGVAVAKPLLLPLLGGGLLWRWLHSRHRRPQNGRLGQPQPRPGLEPQPLTMTITPATTAAARSAPFTTTVRARSQPSTAANGPWPVPPRSWSAMRILLAEDESLLAEPLREFLSRHQHVVTWVSDGDAALQELLGDGYDLALLDWMLPGRDGLEDVVTGLEAGADDYLVKPFRLQELVARIGSLARRAPQPWREALLQWGPLCLDQAAVSVSCAGAPWPSPARSFSCSSGSCVIRASASAAVDCGICCGPWRPMQAKKRSRPTSTICAASCGSTGSRIRSTPCMASVNACGRKRHDGGRSPRWPVARPGKPLQRQQLELWWLYIGSLAAVLLLAAAVVRAVFQQSQLATIRSALLVVSEDLSSLPLPAPGSERDLQESRRDFAASHQQVEWLVRDQPHAVARLGEVRTIGPLPLLPRGKRVLWQQGPDWIAVLRPVDATSWRAMHQAVCGCG